MNFTTDQWLLILDNIGVRIDDSTKWCSAFSLVATDEAFPGGIPEVAAFLGQCLWESSMMGRCEENLDYTATALLAMFPHRVTQDQANAIGRTYDHPSDQKAIANLIYGGQFGCTQLGNTDPDDGWNYRGSGLIQITGKYNFLDIEKASDIPFSTNPDLMRTPGYQSLEGTVAWWHLHVKDKWQDVPTLRKIINAAGLGTTETQGLTKTALSILQAQ